MIKNMSIQSSTINQNDGGGHKWLKIIAICLGIAVLTIILYFALLQPAIDEHNKLIDQRIEELEQQKILIK